MFWILNKKTNAPGIAGSVPAILKITGEQKHKGGITKRRLEDCFSREKEVEFNTDEFRICKTDMFTSKRK